MAAVSDDRLLARIGNRGVCEVLVHVGHAKTGSSWIQRHVLPRHPDLHVPLSNLEVIQRFVVPHDLEFEPDRLARKLRRVDAASRQAGNVAVISSERLCGHPYTGGHDSVGLAGRIESTVPDPYIWMCIRNQVDVIDSIYKHYVRENGTGSLRTFLADEPPIGVPGFRFRFYEYQHLVRHYRRRFGAERVLVTMYEDLQERPEQTLAAVFRFIGVRETRGAFDPEVRLNRSFSDLSCLVLRPLNVLSYYPFSGQHPLVRLPGRRRLRAVLRWLDGRGWGRPFEGTIRSRVRSVVGDRYGAANAELESLLGIDLGARGYDLPE